MSAYNAPKARSGGHGIADWMSYSLLVRTPLTLQRADACVMLSRCKCTRNYIVPALCDGSDLQSNQASWQGTIPEMSEITFVSLQPHIVVLGLKAEPYMTP